jgi:hypothetical protein
MARTKITTRRSTGTGAPRKLLNKTKNQLFRPTPPTSKRLLSIYNLVTKDGKLTAKVERNAGFAGKNCKFVLDIAEGEVSGAHLRYWATPVVTLKGDIVRIDMGEWRTRSTGEAINIFLSNCDTKLQMVRRKWEFLLVDEGHPDDEIVASFGHQEDGGKTPVVFYNLRRRAEVDGF